MSSQLERVKDWPELARLARYNVQRLATLSGVSPRQLRRHFETRLRVSPHKWLHDLRMKRAIELLTDKTSAKETALILGYKDPSHFCRDFKQHFGVPPSAYKVPQTEFGFSINQIAIPNMLMSFLLGLDAMSEFFNLILPC